LKEARRARTLPPIVEGFMILTELDDFETVTGGSIDTTAESVEESRKEIGERGARLIDKELDRLEKDVVAIYESANTVMRERASVSATGLNDDWVTTNYYRGLSHNDRRDLRDIIATCQKIIPTAEGLADVSGTSPTEAVGRAERAKDIERGA
jgi:hypothetical protein